MAYRVVIGGGLGLDEAQIILDARAWQWGYGPQPPLYAWLQRLVFFATESGIAGLAILKNGLLCATVLVVYATLRSASPPAAQPAPCGVTETVETLIAAG